MGTDRKLLELEYARHVGQSFVDSDRAACPIDIVEAKREQFADAEPAVRRDVDRRLVERIDARCEVGDLVFVEEPDGLALLASDRRVIVADLLHVAHRRLPHTRCRATVAAPRAREKRASSFRATHPRDRRGSSKWLPKIASDLLRSALQEPLMPQTMKPCQRGIDAFTRQRSAGALMACAPSTRRRGE